MYHSCVHECSWCNRILNTIATPTSTVCSGACNPNALHRNTLLWQLIQPHCDKFLRRKCYKQLKWRRHARLTSECLNLHCFIIATRNRVVDPYFSLPYFATCMNFTPTFWTIQQSTYNKLIRYWNQYNIK